jgi:tRNA-2-methylthio-N6-dimethylallyladenosine synthase
MHKKKKLHIRTWGCQMNSYDSRRMEDVLRPLGYESVDTPEDADMVILNTCHIREKATDKVFSDLGRLREHKEAKEKAGGKMILAVAGCVAQAEGDIILDRAKYVDMVFGPQTYHQLPEMIAGLTGAYGPKRIVQTDMPVEEKFDRLPEENKVSGPTAFLSIQEGCDKFCTYCVVPYTRGGEYSRPAAAILAEARRLIEAGAKEITLLGQNVNAYHGEGPDGKIWTLGRMLREIAAMDGVERLRYMTSHPGDVLEDLILAHQDIPQLMPFLHLPVQSGSNAVLKAMNRKHTAESYLDTIAQFKKARPDIALSSDFIVGFPGESDQDFEDTLALIREARYTTSYSFKFSARPGTPAANMKGLIREEIKNERLQRLQDLLFRQHREINDTFIGKEIPVLFDGKGNRGEQLHGRTPYNQAIHVAAPMRLFGQIETVRVTTSSATSLTGEIVIKDAQAA